MVSIASSSVLQRKCPTPDCSQWTFAPPIASSVVFSPVTISTMRSEPRYMLALPSTIATTSQKAGMYAPPAALGPNSAHACGMLPEARTWFQKILPAPRRPGNRSTWSVMRAPAESTRYTIGTPVA